MADTTTYFDTDKKATGRPKKPVDLEYKEGETIAINSDYKRPQYKKPLLKANKDALIQDIMELRKMGLTYRQVLAMILEKYGNQLSRSFSLYEVRRLYCEGMAITRKALVETGSEIVQMECDRLDTLFSAVYPLALHGDFKAVDRCLKIMNRRARMLGLDSTTVKVKDWRSEILDLVKAGTISIEDVKQQIPELYGEIVDGVVISRSIGELESGSDEEGYSDEEENDISGEDNQES